MNDIESQLKTLENTISISSNSSIKKKLIYTLLSTSISIIIFRPVYIYKKELIKERLEKNGKKITIYKEILKISIKKLSLAFFLYSILFFIFFTYVYRL